MISKALNASISLDYIRFWPLELTCATKSYPFLVFNIDFRRATEVKGA